MLLNLEVFCPSEIFGNAEWPQTRSGMTAQGDCQDGLKGNPERFCNQLESNGIWGSLVGECEGFPIQLCLFI